MKIAYCIAGTCHSGGMERVLANKANYLVAQGHEVIIVTTDQRGQASFFPLDEHIKCFDLAINYEENNGKSLWNKLLHYPLKQAKHKKRLATVLQRVKPDITVSMFCNDVSFISSIKDGSHKVLEIHFSKYKRLQYGRKGLWHWMDVWRSRQDEKWVKRFEKFVVLTEEDKGYWGNLPNMVVIPNACTFKVNKIAELEAKKVVAVGRYTHQKGFERLVKAWRKVYQSFPDWKLDIVGDGEEREMLQAMINEYGLLKNITLMKPTKDISQIYYNASILAMASRYEGLPMVLLEAQAFGLPVVSFQCKCGPKDIIQDSVNGFLVPEGDIDGLAYRLCELIENEGLRKQMGQAAFISSLSFSEDIIMEKWINLFESLSFK